MPFIDVLFGNETEAEEFCKHRGIVASDIKEMALETSKLPKANTQRDRIVVFTQGREPTIIATNGNVTEHPIIPIRKEDIRDTNGCGDAFVGGFLSELVKGADIATCLRRGQYAASVVIKHWGCTFPDHPQFE
jgi:adenosine kinase